MTDGVYMKCIEQANGWGMEVGKWPVEALQAGSR